MQAEFNKNLVKNLPDAFKKSADSNNRKILEIERAACEDLRKTLYSIDDILDIGKATGKTLDLYGERVGQVRGLANDDKYRLMIKSKIMRSLSEGSTSSVVNALSCTFDCDPAEVEIKDGAEPFTVDVVAISLDAINGAGLTASQVYAMIESMLPVGIKIASFVFAGTFEFGEGENDFDDTKGFADDEGTIGGYLGAAAVEVVEDVLPI